MNDEHYKQNMWVVGESIFGIYYLKKYSLISCHIARKENPRKSPREPPNSATKEVKG